jgi:hypothetical protein
MLTSACMASCSNTMNKILPILLVNLSLPASTSSYTDMSRCRTRSRKPRTSMSVGQSSSLSGTREWSCVGVGCG